MKYRIKIKNYGDIYTAYYPQYKYSFWPFWFYFKIMKFSGNGHTWYEKLYSTDDIKIAQNAIDSDISLTLQKKKKLEKIKTTISYIKYPYV